MEGWSGDSAPMRDTEDPTSLQESRGYRENNAKEILSALRKESDRQLEQKHYAETKKSLTPGSPAFDPGNFLPEVRRPKNTQLVVLTDEMNPEDRASAEADLLLQAGAGAGKAVQLVTDGNAAGMAVIYKMKSKPVCKDCVWLSSSSCLHPAVCLPWRDPVDGTVRHETVFAGKCRDVGGKCGPDGLLFANREEVQSTLQRTGTRLLHTAEQAWSLRKAVHVSVPLYMIPPMALGAWLVEKLLEKIL